MNKWSWRQHNGNQIQRGVRKTKKKKHKKHNLQDSWDNRNHASLCVIGIPEGKERERGIENICEEIMV